MLSEGSVCISVSVFTVFFALVVQYQPQNRRAKCQGMTVPILFSCGTDGDVVSTDLIPSSRVLRGTTDSMNSQERIAVILARGRLGCPGDQRMQRQVALYTHIVTHISIY